MCKINLQVGESPYLNRDEWGLLKKVPADGSVSLLEHHDRWKLERKWLFAATFNFSCEVGFIPSQ
jgi:hypothetical protein